MVYLSLFLLAACADPKKSYVVNTDESQNIIGGQDQSLTQKINHSVAAILLTNSDGNLEICTGTFISKNMLITAAHCVPKVASDVTIKIGNSIFDEKKSQTLNVLKIYKHPDYKKGKNDLALIHIEEDKNIFILPVELVRSSDQIKNKNLILFGFGVDQIAETEDGLQGAGLLRKLKIQAQFVSKSDDKIMLNQSQGYGVCHGDSGGPAFVTVKNKYVLVSIASGVLQQEDQLDCTNQAVFTSVAEHLDWIYSILIQNK